MLSSHVLGKRLSVHPPVHHVRRGAAAPQRAVCGVRVASAGASGEGMSAEAYIRHVLSSPPPLRVGEEAEPDVQEPPVFQAAQEVSRQLTTLNELNQTLKGQLHNVTSGLETIIHSARAHQAPNGAAAHQAPNGAHHTNGNGARPPAGAGGVLLQPPPQQQQQQHQQPAAGGGVPGGSEDGDSVLHTSTLSCVVQHPGALCCTKTTASSSPATMTCTVSLETTARISLDDTVARQLSMEDLNALAAQALVGAAAEYCRARTQASQARAHPERRLQQHAELVSILQHGTIVAAERNRPSQFGHESYILMLADPHTGRRVRAVFKPRVEGDAEGWHRAPIEWVAYELNLMLGMDYVPPVAYRRGGIDIDLGGEEGVVSHEEGAMMYWIENASQLKHYSPELWGVPQDVLLSDTRILDVLLHNSDRHHGHFLLGRHWCEGSWQGHEWCGDLLPALIDHAAGFRRDAHVTLQHENAFQTGPVRCVSPSTYLRLRFLDAASIQAKFSEVLSEREMREMLHRRNYVLRYLDRLVEDQGYAATVVEG